METSRSDRARSSTSPRPCPSGCITPASGLPSSCSCIFSSLLWSIRTERICNCSVCYLMCIWVCVRRDAFPNDRRRMLVSNYCISLRIACGGDVFDIIFHFLCSQARLPSQCIRYSLPYMLEQTNRLTKNVPISVTHIPYSFFKHSFSFYHE